MPNTLAIHHPRLDSLIPKAYGITYVRGVAMTSITATEARKALYKLVEDVSGSHEPVQITGKREIGRASCRERV